jgi:hypothetical protein
VTPAASERGRPKGIQPTTAEECICDGVPKSPPIGGPERTDTLNLSIQPVPEPSRRFVLRLKSSRSFSHLEVLETRAASRTTQCRQPSLVGREKKPRAPRLLRTRGGCALPVAAVAAEVR